MTVTTKKRSVRRQDLDRIIGRSILHRDAARRIVMARTGIVIDEDMHYVFKLRDEIYQGVSNKSAECDSISRMYERTAIDLIEKSTTISAAENGIDAEINPVTGKRGLKFSATCGATYQQMKNCEYYAGVKNWYCGIMGGYNVNSPAMIGKNSEGQTVAVIAGLCE